jgi:hypothetical protein
MVEAAEWQATKTAMDAGSAQDALAATQAAAAAEATYAAAKGTVTAAEALQADVAAKQTAVAAEAAQAELAAKQTAAAAEAAQAELAAKQTADAAEAARAATQTAEARPPTPVPPPPPCPIDVDPQLAGAWDRDRLGCATAPSKITWAAWEAFERGYMVWRSDTDRVYVFFFAGGSNPGTGEYLETPDEWRWDGSNPDGVGLSPPPGLYEPVRGFGYAWREFLGGPDGRLGWAREEEKGFCANIQPFERGLLLHSNKVEFCEDRQFNWAREPSFAPLFFALYGDGIWRRF